MKLLSELVYEWKNFSDLYKDYKVGIVRSRKSYVSGQLDIIDKNCKDLKQMLVQASQTKINQSMSIIILTGSKIKTIEVNNDIFNKT